LEFNIIILFMIVYLPRETVEETELLGYRVPARTRVVINVWAIGRDPAMWERAEEFIPDRFVVVDGPLPRQSTWWDKISALCSLVPEGGGALGSGSPRQLSSEPVVPFRLGAAERSLLCQVSVWLKASLHLVAKPWSP
jgi:hypothetical protein